MRPIHVARIDKSRPALVLTRSAVRGSLQRVTVAPVTSRILGLQTEIVVGTANGLDHESVINLDNVTTIAAADLGRQIGRLLPQQEVELREALSAAFDLVEP